MINMAEEYARRKREKYHSDAEHRSKIIARNVTWCKAHRGHMNAYSRKWYARNAERVQQEQKERRLTLKNEALAAYGDKCACCGETGKWFLTIDHVDGRKNVTHKKRLTGWLLYAWLKKQGYPQDEFRCLCFNCNCARGILGHCPHEEQR